MTMLDASYFNNIRGAVYFPSRAYNAWQTWNELDPAEIDRDFGYAEEAGINALRMFTSYEYWQEAPETFFEKFESVIALSAKHGIRIMPVLFEDCGEENTPENRASKEPLTAVCVRSPRLEVQQTPELFPEVNEYVDAFMTRFGSDERLLAIECMNEPNERRKNIAFSQYVVKRCKGFGGSVPLSIGCISLWHNLWYGDDLGVLQYHDNFPQTIDFFKMELREGQIVQKHLNKPVWITEWQRIREKGPGWDVAAIDPEYTLPKLASLADAVYESGLGNFFWSLMVKPAYLTAQRPNGTYNGLFHEDGSVYSLEDYQKVSHCDRVKPVTPTNAPWYLEALKK